jgi:hypothetical protein
MDAKKVEVLAVIDLLKLRTSTQDEWDSVIAAWDAIAELIKVARLVDQYKLVIESAVRNADPVNRLPVLNILCANTEILSRLGAPA